MVAVPQTIIFPATAKMTNNNTGIGTAPPPPLTTTTDAIYIFLEIVASKELESQRLPASHGKLLE
jgi:hypothetical protein